MEKFTIHLTRKDRRKKLTGGKAVDNHCRNNGVCPVCTSNRTYKNQKRLLEIKSKENEI